MKSSIISVLLMINFIQFSAVAQEKNKVEDKKYPEITFENKDLDLGIVNEGDKVKAVFRFTNTGNDTLKINAIKPTCGYIIPKKWKETPILPGEEGQFVVLFNSKNKPEKQKKIVRVYCNTKKQKELASFSVYVTPDSTKIEERKELKRLRREAYRKKHYAKYHKSTD